MVPCLISHLTIIDTKSVQVKVQPVLLKQILTDLRCLFNTGYLFKTALNTAIDCI